VDVLVVMIVFNLVDEGAERKCLRSGNATVFELHGGLSPAAEVRLVWDTV